MCYDKSVMEYKMHETFGTLCKKNQKKLQLPEHALFPNSCSGSGVKVTQPTPHTPHAAPCSTRARTSQLCWTWICPELTWIKKQQHTGCAIVKQPCSLLLLLTQQPLSSLGGLRHNFNHKPALANPFVVWKKSGACVPHILLIPGSSEKDHDFWDGVARGKVAPGTCCWKWQLRKADWSTAITTREKSEDSEDSPPRFTVLRVCVCPSQDI